MDINLIRGLGTFVVFVAFIGLCFWAYSPKRKQAFHEAEMLPFEDDINAHAQNKTGSQTLGENNND